MKNVLLFSALLMVGVSFTAEPEQLGREQKYGRFTDEDGNRKSLRIENQKDGLEVKRSERIKVKNIEKGDHNKNSVNLHKFNKQQ